MEINKEAVKALVRGTRVLMRAAENMQKLVPGRETELDRAKGFLLDGLFLLDGEPLNPKIGFQQTSTVITMSQEAKYGMDDDFYDDLVADAFCELCECFHGDQERSVWENKDEKAKVEAAAEPVWWYRSLSGQVRENGGYHPDTGYVPPKKVNKPKSTPEGEWK